jgi:hypothetical protein
MESSTESIRMFLRCEMRLGAEKRKRGIWGGIYGAVSFETFMRYYQGHMWRTNGSSPERIGVREERWRGNKRQYLELIMDTGRDCERTVAFVCGRTVGAVRRGVVCSEGAGNQIGDLVALPVRETMSPEPSVE